MKHSLLRFSCFGKAALIGVAAFFSNLVSVHAATDNPPAPADGALVSKYLFFNVPGQINSKSATSIMSDSGDVSIVPEAPLAKDGKLGKLKRIFGFLNGATSPFEMKLASNGAKISFRLANANTVSVTMNSSTGNATARFKGRSGTSAINQTITVPISNSGSNWTDSATKTINFSKSNPTLRIVPNYSGQPSASPSVRSAANALIGTPILGDLESAKLAEFSWLITKLVAIATGIIDDSLDPITYPVIREAFRPIAGFGPAIAGFYGSIRFANPASQTDVLNEVFSIVDQLPDYADVAPIIDDVLDLLLRGTNLLAVPSLWPAVQDTMELVRDKPSHPLPPGIVLKILYTWPADQRDLDTATTFLGQTVGFGSSRSSTYLSWTGDDTGAGGREQVTCLISTAAADGVLPANFDITAKAGWYTNAGGSGPASLQMQLENPLTGTPYGPPYQLTIAPGRQSGAPTTPVGSASFTFDPLTTRIQWEFN